MKKILPIFFLFAACNKEISKDYNAATTSNTNTLSASTLVVNGSLDLQTAGVNVASLGVVNYRSEDELCGTAGSDLLWPVNLPLADSSVYPLSALQDGDTLTASLYLDTTYSKKYNISITILENNILVNNQTVYHRGSFLRNFVFHNGSKYEVSATVQ